MKIFVKILTTAQQIIYNFYINKIFFQEFCLGTLTELLTYAIIIVILKVPNKKRREMSKIEKENVTTKEVEYSLKDIDDKILLNLRDFGMRLRFLYDGKDSQRRALILLLISSSMSQRELTDRLDIKPGSWALSTKRPRLSETTSLLARTAKIFSGFSSNSFIKSAGVEPVAASIVFPVGNVILIL